MTDDDKAEVVVPFKKPLALPANNSAQGVPSFSDLLISVEMLNQQLFIMQNAITALLASAPEDQRRLALNLVEQSGPRYQSAFDVWPADVVRPPMEDLVKVYSALFRVKV